MKKFNKGFTLIELLAVIAILAIILLIAVPQVLDTISSSKVAAKEKSAMFIYEGVESYIAQQTLAGATIATITPTLIDDYVSVTPTSISFTITNGVITGTPSVVIEGYTCTWGSASKTDVTCVVTP